jgi:hypothetical protein
MYVKHLQEYLDKFTNGKKGNAVSNAKIFIYVNGYLEEIKRIEVHEHAMSQPGAESIRIVLKPNSRGPWSKVLENFFTIPVPWFKDHGA